jgi:hypothetical protein
LYFVSLCRSDADAEVLAEYIIALLKHDGNKESVRELCEQEIPDFLTEGMLCMSLEATRKSCPLTSCWRASPFFQILRYS